MESEEEETGTEKTTSHAKEECQVVPTTTSVQNKNKQTHKDGEDKDLYSNLAKDSFGQTSIFLMMLKQSSMHKEAFSWTPPPLQTEREMSERTGTMMGRTRGMTTTRMIA